MKVTRTQMWIDLTQAGGDGRKLNGKSNRILLELWQQLKPEQQFQPLRLMRQRSETEPRVQPVYLQDFLLGSKPTSPEPTQEGDCGTQFD